jgi:signal transduction histidine kinase
LAIISASKKRKGRLYGSSHIRYALVYIVITSVFLLFLNIYSADASKRLFYQNKQNSMIEKCLFASSEISALEVLNPTAAASAVERMDSLRVTRLIITDRTGIVVYDSEKGQGGYALFPEIVTALRGNDIFSWSYQDGVMQSRAATPVYSYGTLIGSVYMMEYDAEQGALVQSLQKNVLYITLVLEVVVILFAVIFSAAFSQRFRQLMTSLRIIREGNYSHKVKLKGSDELKFLAKEVNDLTDRVQESENKRRNFVSDASHELKTPLASIKLLSDSILQNDMDMPTVREFVGDIGAEAERLNRLSEKLLSLSRIETQQDGDCEIIYVTPTLQRVERMLAGLAQKNQNTIALEIRKDCPVLMLEDDLYEIIFNLAENGIKYNVPGGKLTISVDRDEDNAIIQVADTGMGIPQDAVGHVFERFFRVDKARSRKSGGSGLGLAIVRNLVERNQGAIRVESQVGEGTVFTVTFPAFDVEEESL